MNRKISEARRGFTLVELMMVVLIISLLIFIMIPAVTGVVKEVDIHQTQMLVNLLDLGVGQYKTAYGDYPPNCYNQPPVSNLDGWNWGTDPSVQKESAFILTYCLQGPAGMGWRMNRDGKQSTNASASVTADFGPWVESGNQSIQPMCSDRSGNTYYRPTFVDSFGTEICYFKAQLTYQVNGGPMGPGYHTIPTNKTLSIYPPGCSFDPNFKSECGQTMPSADRYRAATPGNATGANGDGIRDLWPSGSYLSMAGGGIQNNLNLTGVGPLSMFYYEFYAAVMNESYNPSGGWSVCGTGNGQVYNPNTFLIWSAGPDGLFGFWYFDETLGGNVADLTFNPLNFDDITNFR